MIWVTLFMLSALVCASFCGFCLGMLVEAKRSLRFHQQQAANALIHAEAKRASWSPRSYGNFPLSYENAVTACDLIPSHFFPHTVQRVERPQRRQRWTPRV